MAGRLRSTVNSTSSAAREGEVEESERERGSQSDRGSTSGKRVLQLGECRRQHIIKVTQLNKTALDICRDDGV